MTPHWPGGAIAEPPTDGGRYLVDETGLIIGYASPTYYVSPEDLPKFRALLNGGSTDE
jgi:hypothetical protein